MRTKPEKLAEALRDISGILRILGDIPKANLLRYAADRLELLEAENGALRGLLNGLHDVPSEQLEAYLRYEREKAARSV